MGPHPAGPGTDATHVPGNLGADVQKAVEAAMAAGALSGWQLLLLYLHYLQDWSCEQIAHEFGVSEAAVRREHRNALQAIRRTRLLDGYD